MPAIDNPHDSLFPVGCNRCCHDCQRRDQCPVPFNQMFSSASEAICLIANDTIILANHSALDLVGVSDVQQLLGLQPSYFSPKYQPCNTLSHIKSQKMQRQAYREGHCTFEWLMQRHDGAVVPLNVSLRAMPFAKEKVLVARAQSIDAEKKASADTDFFIELARQLFTLARQLKQQINAHQTIDWTGIIKPILVSIIKQANLKGVTEVAEPQQTVDLLVQLGIDLHRILHSSASAQHGAYQTFMITSYLESIERSLNLATGTVTLSAEFYQLMKEVLNTA